MRARMAPTWGCPYVRRGNRIHTGEFSGGAGGEEESEGEMNAGPVAHVAEDDRVHPLAEHLRETTRMGERNDGERILRSLNRFTG